MERQGSRESLGLGLRIAIGRNPKERRAEIAGDCEGEKVFFADGAGYGVAVYYCGRGFVGRRAGIFAGSLAAHKIDFHAHPGRAGICRRVEGSFAAVGAER